ncbi:c-type cytochrome [Falsiroseomonas sp. HW251]|uniref:c-type cytochrome n=1 Tax=Falsiroseomonas sp. HW251 TaxID=3390998 RepID=UPI003D31388B
MHMRSAFGVTLALLATSTPLAADHATSPRLGRPASSVEVESWDISVAPDGEGLPPGRGTVAQGREIYVQRCQSCHGERGQGRPADRLTGGVGTLASPAPIRTVASFWPYATTLFDYVRRAMPIQAPLSLTDNEVYAVVGYILSVDAIVPETADLDAAGIRAIRMPNRDGFVPWPSSR